MTERIFTKSSYTTPANNCVEVAPPVDTHVSSYSSGNGGNCVEIAETLNSCVMIGDTKIPNGPEKPYVHVGPDTFAAFAGSLTAEYAHLEV